MMEYLTANNIIFALLSAVILICALLSVTTNKLLRAAIYLFFALIGIAGLYLQLSYEFLAAVELSVYAGGIVILFVFAIFLVHRIGENSEEVSLSKKVIAGLAAAAGVALCLSTLFMYEYTTFHLTPEAQMNAETFTQTINMDMIGKALLGTGKHQYLLPFEATGILLLACIIGSLVIAKKEKEDNK